MKKLLIAAVLLASACTPPESDAQRQIKQNKLDALEMERRDAEAARML